MLTNAPVESLLINSLFHLFFIENSEKLQSFEGIQKAQPPEK